MVEIEMDNKLFFSLKIEKNLLLILPKFLILIAILHISKKVLISKIILIKLNFFIRNS
jgi:hypothetical protein